MYIIDLETPAGAEKYFAPKMDDEYPFYLFEYGITHPNMPCYQLRMNSPLACVQYVISGSGIIICNDRLYTVQAGDTFLLPEGSNHIYYSNPDNHFARIWLNFKGELSRKLIEIYGLSNTVVYRSVNTYDLFLEIHETCKSLQDPATYKNQTAQLFLKLIQLLADNKKPDHTPTSAVEQIRLYIDCHLTENLKISDIAQNFSFSEEHLIRLFKKNYAITPHQYLLQSKIRLAMIMLKMTDHSISEIAENLGFSDTHHFAVQFKKYTGFQPSAYRKN